MPFFSKFEKKRGKGIASHMHDVRFVLKSKGIDVSELLPRITSKQFAKKPLYSGRDIAVAKAILVASLFSGRRYAYMISLRKHIQNSGTTNAAFAAAVSLPLCSKHFLLTGRIYLGGVGLFHFCGCGNKNRIDRALLWRV